MTIINAENWEFANTDKFPYVYCPKCKQCLLGDTCTHGIRSNGTIYESVRCPCGFHDHVQLANWIGKDINRGKK